MSNNINRNLPNYNIQYEKKSPKAKRLNKTNETAIAFFYWEKEAWREKDDTSEHGLLDKKAPKAATAPLPSAGSKGGVGLKIPTNQLGAST